MPAGFSSRDNHVAADIDGGRPAADHDDVTEPTEPAEPTEPNADRRRVYKRRNAERGRCEYCPMRRAPGDPRLCADCRQAERRRDRERKAAERGATRRPKAWRPGGPGRPPGS